MAMYCDDSDRATTNGDKSSSVITVQAKRRSLHKYRRPWSASFVRNTSTSSSLCKLSVQPPSSEGRRRRRRRLHISHTAPFSWMKQTRSKYRSGQGRVHFYSTSSRLRETLLLTNPCVTCRQRALQRTPRSGPGPNERRPGAELERSG